MRRIRTIVMWLVEAGLALLVVLAIVGAFLGAERAKTLFNSLPLMVFWGILGLLLVGGFAVYPCLVKRPAGLAMHLGALLILVGAMWGSDGAHALRADLLGSKKIASGFMGITEGTRENRVLAPDGRTVVGELPFDLALRDFWIDYYEMPGRRWQMAVVAPVYGGDGRLVDRRQTDIAWEVGQAVAVPFTRAEMTVLAYLPHAKATYAEGAAPGVEIAAADGKTVRLPARVGAEVTLDDPPLTIRALRVFACMKVRRAGDGFEPYEAEGEGINPAVELEFEHPDGTRETRLAMALMPEHGRRPGDPAFRYVFPRATGAEADPDSRVPAAQVRVTCDGREMTRWLLPGRDEPYTSIDLAPVVPPREPPGDGDDATPEPMEATLAPELFFVRPMGPIRDYFSDLAVMVGGETVAEKTIEVNDPLHWGGYHLYQSDYDHEAGRYTVLQVVSDSGLLAVWAGMVLLVGGAFWRFWGEPVVGKLRG